MKDEGLLAIGVVVRPHGVQGKIRVNYHGDAPENFCALKEIHLGNNPDHLSHHRVLHIQASRGLFILTLEGFTLLKAQSAVGQPVWVDREQFPPLGEEEYYWEDLIGLPVLTEEGEDLGTVYNLLRTGSNDVLICQKDQSEVLIPFLEDIVLDVDLKRGSIIVRLVDGLTPEQS
jgi:16S rRNA processing protein RimM